MFACTHPICAHLFLYDVCMRVCVCVWLCGRVCLFPHADVHAYTHSPTTCTHLAMDVVTRVLTSVCMCGYMSECVCACVCVFGCVCACMLVFSHDAVSTRHATPCILQLLIAGCWSKIIVIFQPVGLKSCNIMKCIKKGRGGGWVRMLVGGGRGGRQEAC